MSAYTKETYSELYEFLELIGNEYVSKIPNKLLKLFEENRSENYTPHINPNVLISEQELNEDTLTIIAFLNLKYWCNDDEEIKKLKAVYKQNEDIYQSNLNKQFDYKDIFKNKTKEYEPTTTTEMVEYKPIPFYKKIINIIKRMINRKHK